MKISQLSEGDIVSIKVTSPGLLIRFGISLDVKDLVVGILERANMERKDIDRIITLYSSFTVVVSSPDLNLTIPFADRSGITDLPTASIHPLVQ